MQKINVLPTHISNLIAAGEVVDRPASVVKELVENAVDAGATEITVEIKRGGTTFLRVTDNGSGMSPENAKLCFLRHATSKIETEQDLAQIQTLGFRGEALAAIAAVSKISLLTRMKEDISGTNLLVEGGEILDVSACGCPQGTTLVVQELFFNTPARQKFLKKDSTEAAVIGSVLEKLAISMPFISIQYIKDGKACMHTLGNGDLKSTLYAATGADFLQNARAVNYALDGLTVTGLICCPEHVRPNRALQSFFVNGRYVRSRTLQTAFEEAYQGEIPTGKYPCGALFLQLDASAVDANVHPQKMEIKFSSENAAYSTVFHGVKNALQTAEPKKLEFGAKSKTSGFFSTVKSENFLKALADSKKTENSPAKNQTVAFGSAVFHAPPSAITPTKLQASTPKYNAKIDVDASEWGYSAPIKRVETPFIEPPFPTEKEPTEEPPSPTEQMLISPIFEKKTGKVIGEAFGTYILAEVEDVLWFIDKHAARERIIFEELKRNHHVESQKLLSPQVVVLGRSNVSLAETDKGAFERMGFELDAFGDNAVLVRSVPMNIQDYEGLLLELCTLLESGKQGLTPKIYENALHSIACKAAVKGNTYEQPEAIQHLVDELIALPDIKHCPHGRPVRSTLTKAQLEKEFGRT